MVEPASDLFSGSLDPPSSPPPSGSSTSKEVRVKVYWRFPNERDSGLLPNFLWLFLNLRSDQGIALSSKPKWKFAATQKTKNTKKSIFTAFATPGLSAITDWVSHTPSQLAAFHFNKPSEGSALTSCFVVFTVGATAFSPRPSQPSPRPWAAVTDAGLCVEPSRDSRSESGKKGRCSLPQWIWWLKLRLGQPSL